MKREEGLSHFLRHNNKPQRFVVPSAQNSGTRLRSLEPTDTEFQALNYTDVALIEPTVAPFDLFDDFFFDLEHMN
jgi:hypothetical protein